MGHKKISKRRLKIKKQRDHHMFLSDMAFTEGSKHMTVMIMKHYCRKGLEMKKDYRVFDYGFTHLEDKDHQILEWIRVIERHIKHYGVEIPSVAHDHLKLFQEYENRRSTTKQRWQARKLRREVKCVEKLKPENKEKRKM